MKRKTCFIECNIGFIDRITRICLAVLLVFLGYFYDIWWLYLIAVILMITAILGFCALYKVFGINTCSEKEKF